MIIFCQLQIAVYYQKRLIIHQKILCFRKLSLGLEIVPVIITGLIPWLPCDIEKDCIFCFYCMKNVSKLTTEKNTEPAHTLVRFEDLKNALECFKDHQNSKRYKGAATLAVIVPSCGDPLAMMNQQPAKSRAEEPKYLKFVMECIQYLSGQRMPIRGSVNVNQGMPIISMIIWHSYWSFEIKANQQFWKRFLLLQPVKNANTHTNSTKTN